MLVERRGERVPKLQFFPGRVNYTCIISLTLSVSLEGGVAKDGERITGGRCVSRARASLQLSKLRFKIK